MTGSATDVAESAEPSPRDPPEGVGPHGRILILRTLRDRRRRASSTQPPRLLEPTFSGVGLVAGALFIAVSLEPSLLPRIPIVQGVATGVSFMVGYGLGAGAHAIWNYLEVPNLRGRARIIVGWTVLGLIGLSLGLAIWRWVGWQNGIRRTFGMEELDPTAWPIVVGIALVVAAALLVAARALRMVFRWADQLLLRFLPHRLAVTLATAGMALLLWLLFSGVLVQGFFVVANWAFSARDLNDRLGTTEVASALRSGGDGSLVAWEDLGRQGRAFVSGGPTVDELASWSGGAAVEPIRVFVGLRSADTLEERAQLLLDELVRTGAFDRDVLVLTTTTGTGFIDANAADSLEFLYDGDTAIAGLQYSYLPSWISLLADQEAVDEASQVTFRLVHDYWAELPADARPEFYLYGLSLGSAGVESILSSIDILNEPVDGALMTGPTFLNLMHNELERSRDAGSPAWLPVVSDGRTVRFTGEQDALGEPTARWGDTRVVYLQHGSDPVVFFSPVTFYREPEWLQGSSRAPDVSPEMRWFPLITGWQTMLDMPAAGSVPEGFGHMYTAKANLQAWVGVTDPEGWDAADTAALGDYLNERRQEQLTLLEQLGR
ncbi:alpha/beta-hydrolase family protein [Demequina sp. SYSU T00192]|uniref:Alpha/beta-hydrolase family protein n=1 Tax=Demequina litoralis TaxID=3051660 RepID=A0ABT8G9M2_9MICO|nr:alpha/beta-hydrolase family protein [Demequina sp. SYSU T00192]MDN4475840.1 alpha/beta-hydrolase family protein [Demequina sp. SYSU T00192]